MIEGILVLLVELFGELILQVLSEVVLRVLFSFTAPKEYHLPPWVTLLGWICIGALAGMLSLAVLPQFLIRDAYARVAALILIPVLMGLLTWCMGQLQDARDRLRLPMDTFWFGYGFGMSFQLVRYMGAQ